MVVITKYKLIIKEMSEPNLSLDDKGSYNGLEQVDQEETDIFADQRFAEIDVR